MDGYIERQTDTTLLKEGRQVTQQDHLEETAELLDTKINKVGGQKESCKWNYNDTHRDTQGDKNKDTQT